MDNAYFPSLIATEADKDRAAVTLNDIFGVQVHQLALDAAYGPRGTPMRRFYTGPVQHEMVADFWEFSTNGQI